MVDNSNDPNYLDEVDMPLSGKGTGEYNNVEQTIKLIASNASRLQVNQKEVQHILKTMRADYEEFRDRGFAALDAMIEGTEITSGSWLMIRLNQLASRMNSRMQELEDHGVLPKRVPPCEECSGHGMTGDPDTPENRLPVTCMKCGGTGESGE